MFKHYIKRTVRKIIAIPFYFIFSIANLIVKPVSVLLRLISLPGAMVTLLIAGINYFNSGILNITLQFIIMAILSGVTYIFAPYLPSFTHNKYNRLKNIVFYPIVIKPPVRFTM